MPISEGTHLLDYDINDNPIYEGWAIRSGADMSEAVWKIKRYTWSAGTTEQIMTEEAWCDGNMLYDNIWDDRDAVGTTYIVAVV